jgi:O-antigen ligase
MRLGSAIRKIFTIAVCPHLTRWIEGVGVIGLFIFAFGIFFKDRTANSGILIMGIAFILIFRPMGKSLIRDPLLIFGSFFFLFVSIQAFRAIITFDGYQVMIVNRMFLYGCVFLLIFIVSFWLHQAKEKRDWLLFTFLAGFLAQIIRKGEWVNFMEVASLYWTGVKRAGFGSPVNRFGLWSAIVLLACALFHKRLWGCSGKNPWCGMRVIFWLFMCAVSAMGTVFSQSRGVWLAAAIVIPLSVFYLLYITKQLRFKAIALLAIIAISFALLTNLPEIIERRVFSGEEDYKEVIQGSIDFQAKTVSDNIKAISERLIIYKYFLEKWKERPLIGYGPGVSEILLKRANNEYGQISRYNHFHNIALDILIQLGCVGLVLYAGGFYIVIRQLIRGRQRGQVELDYYLFVAAGFTLFAITAQFSQPLNATKGLYAVGLLGGIGYSSTFMRIDTDPIPPA